MCSSDLEREGGGETEGVGERDERVRREMDRGKERETEREVCTCGRSAMYLAQCRISLMASMLVSGKAALHTNSDRHFTASWNESMATAKCCWKVFTDDREMEGEKERRERVNNRRDNILFET